MKAKKKGTLILDLSDPRTVDEKVSSIKGIKLVNPSQIAEMMEESTKSRKDAVSAAEKMISPEVPIIEATLRRLNGNPLVKA